MLVSSWISLFVGVSSARLVTASGTVSLVSQQSAAERTEWSCADIKKTDCTACYNYSSQCHWCDTAIGCAEKGDLWNGCTYGTPCPTPAPPPPTPAPPPWECTDIAPSDCKGCVAYSSLCHWCGPVTGCHAIGSTSGCMSGTSCDAPPPTPAPPPWQCTDIKASDCKGCYKYSEMCHWCGADTGCHAIGSTAGCAMGVDCNAPPAPPPTPTWHCSDIASSDCDGCYKYSELCHWCGKDVGCQAKGDIYHGCTTGTTCGDQPPVWDCTFGKSCDACYASSTLCHWCGELKTPGCHAKGDIYNGCVNGDTCPATPAPPPPTPAPTPGPPTPPGPEPTREPPGPSPDKDKGWFDAIGVSGIIFIVFGILTLGSVVLVLQQRRAQQGQEIDEQQGTSMQHELDEGGDSFIGGIDDDSYRPGGRGVPLDNFVADDVVD